MVFNMSPPACWNFTAIYIIVPNTSNKGKRTDFKNMTYTIEKVTWKNTEKLILKYHNEAFLSYFHLVLQSKMCRRSEETYCLNVVYRIKDLG